MSKSLDRFRPPAAARSLQWIVLIALLMGLALRFVHFSSPPYDAHGFRQTQTLSTIEFFHTQGIDLLRPRTLYMGYPGVLVLELPLFQALAAVLYGVWGPHLEIVRLLNILFGVGTAWLLYRVVELLLDRPTGLLSALIYWLAPLNIGYQRSMLIDPMGVFCGLLSFCCLASLVKNEGDHDLSGSSRFWILFTIFAVATWMAAMIKALYLWPSVLLFGWAFVTQRVTINVRTLGVVAAFGLSGLCFLLWNRYAGRVNDGSPFSQGVQPTSLLGFSPLIDPQFYYIMLIRRPKWWLGVFGVLLYPIGLVAGWSERRDPARTWAFFLLTVIPPTYLLLFSFINRPHEYYQLIITPFLAVVPANGLRWLGTRWWNLPSGSNPIRRLLIPAICVGMLIATPLTYILWYHGGRPDSRVVEFEKLCAGKTQPGASGMVFVAVDLASAIPNSDSPEFLYAAHLWGYSRVVPNEAAARASYEKFASAFPKLDFVILYGVDRPTWLDPKRFSLTTEDSEHRLFIYRHAQNG